ncbi:alpha-N-arabinofuranosidase [Niabella ginsenosidivorans]|uniref:non-reducing end alpha-L-arabinofuranosidase n=1 Tax=Niabella ginsenosidivorans TaxID=1176587 RepID=A0A1A9HZK9_9BACT|nr:alpha-L-arabinofuranosidase C-terminal domain-containing protein [Niabella ginsenosidivorans]ANH80847.1 alpha-N-arabinofuranosidase [Niabella ginsenosidivorans]
MKKGLFLFLSGMLFLMSFGQQQAVLTIDAAAPKTTISRHIYGQFSEHLGHCIYDGYWVDEKMNVPKKDRIRLDVVAALKKIHIPNLRWPGGCFADEYHWRDGIGERSRRPKMINTHWGGVTEDNSFGTHEFLELCELLDAEPYIAGNMGSGTVEEMSRWVEYLNADGDSPMTRLRKANGRDQPWKVPFWGVGNESWGCGGNMTPEYYASEFRRYATFARNYPGAPLKKIASGANADDYNWTEVCMKNIPQHMMWGLSLHYYTVPTGNWGRKGSATSFNETEYFKTMQRCLHMEELVAKHSAIMDRYDPEKKVALVVDEWGIWTDPEPGTNPGFLYQQNSLRDALIAGTTLNIFNNHADRVRMANLAQTVNVLQALILTKGTEMLLTPTYYVFDLFKEHMDAKLLPIQLAAPGYNKDGATIPAVNASASVDSNGRVHITLVNLDADNAITVQTTLKGKPFKTVSGRILTSGKFTDINTFENKNLVKPVAFNGFKQTGAVLSVQLPRLSIVSLTLE